MYRLRQQSCFMKTWRSFLVVAALCIIDQLSKLLATKDLLPQAGGLLSPACNPNIAWSLPISRLAFRIAWLAAIALVLAIYFRTGKPFPLTLVIAGAILNLVDRWRFGCVIDFIDLGIFPTFNLADMMITGGFGLYLLNYYRTNKNSQV